jgi:hypothetical protein
VGRNREDVAAAFVLRGTSEVVTQSVYHTVRWNELLARVV